MGKKGVEDMISELEIFIDNCKYSPLSTNKILVPKDEIASMLNELRLKLPSEIDRSKKIMRNKEAILTDARNRADALLQEANEEANRRVADSQIVELANIQANEIVTQAQQQAASIIKAARDEENEVRLGAMLYTKSQLDNIKKYIVSTLEAEKTNYEHLIASLENDNFVVDTNSEEIEGQIRMMQGGVVPASGDSPEVGRAPVGEQMPKQEAPQMQPEPFKQAAVMPDRAPVVEPVGVGEGIPAAGPARVSNPVADAASVVQQALAEQAMASRSISRMPSDMISEPAPKPRSVGTVIDGASEEPLW